MASEQHPESDGEGIATSDAHEHEQQSYDDDNYIFFWKPNQPNGWASQWHAEPFKGPPQAPEEVTTQTSTFSAETDKIVSQGAQADSEEVTYHTAETWMMYQKAILFGDKEIAEQILETTDPKQTKELGRRIADFDAEIWESKRYDIVVAGSLAKFKSSAQCKEKLLATGDRQLVEASPFDR